jgi:teichuronic acid biosynthesis glycosyltransferase TuaC
MKFLIFSEEYFKVTKGMFVVWMTHAWEASKNHNVEILLNHEHWAFDEANEAFLDKGQVAVQRLPFDMPSTVLKRLLAVVDSVWPLRGLRFVLGQVLNIALSPLIIVYIAARLRQIRPSAVVSHNGGWPAGQLCRWIMVSAMLARVPRRLFVIHNYPAKSPRFLARLLSPLRFLQARIVEKCATSIVTVSDSLKACLEAEVFRRPVVRIYNGIGLSSPINGHRSYSPSLDWHPSGRAVGFVGALYPLKGPHVLLDAFRLVKTPCELALLGPAEPHYLQSLRQRAERCTNKVTFLGFHDDVDSFMPKIDFLVVPSIAYESFGMVILEAMKHKAPVICSDFGGMKEVVKDGVTGLVVPAGDEPALANAITRLLEDADMRRRMGDAGYRRLNELFTSEKMVAQYDRLLS